MLIITAFSLEFPPETMYYYNKKIWACGVAAGFERKSSS
jgi:hypothetical protein